MRKLLLFIIAGFLYNLAISQEVKIETNKVDEFDGTRTIGTSPKTGKYFKLNDYIDVEGTLVVWAYYNKTKEGNESYFITLMTRTKNLGCLSEYDGKCIFLFDNGEILELTQLSSTNCDSPSLVASYVFCSRNQMSEPAIRDIELKNYDKIRTTPVKKIRIYGTEGIADYTLKDEKKDILIKHFKIINESK